MKKSQYNFVRKVGTQYVLYNAATENTTVLDPIVAQLYQDKLVNEIKDLHPEFYDYLCNSGYIVSDDADELQSIIKQWDSEDNDPRSFSLSINPTLNCNMDCWYCYEKHDGDLNMKEPVVSSIRKLIINKLSDKELTRFHFGFFGGEPLLCFNRIVKNLIDFTTERGLEYGKAITLSFVTNGYLLSEEILEYLQKVGHKTTFQITLDGNEDIHNCVRHTKSGDRTYERILKNASRILEYPNMNLVLRCNFTAESLTSFIDVATDLSEWVKNPKLDIRRLSVDLHQVWQDYAESRTVDINALECEVRNAFAASDIPLSIIRKAQRYRCYAERNNSVLVNYNGDLFRCTARDFTRENREGVLTDNGILVWNDRSKNRNDIKWSNPTCCLCEIYPLCGGACSQNKLESKRISGCDYGYAQKDKDDIITARIEWLLAKAQNNNINH